MKNRTKSRTFSLPMCLVLATGALSTVVVLSGCEDDEIHAYRVPRQAPNQATNQASAPTRSSDAPAGGQAGEGGANGVSWTMPTAWHETETTSSMRIATFHAVDEIEVTVAAFPGDVGGMVANVNRWRGQVGLDPTDDAGVNAHTEPVEDSDVIIIDIMGTNDRLVGSVIDVGDGQTWFVKVIGDSKKLDQIKPDLIEFSVSFHVHQKHSHTENEPAAAAGGDVEAMVESGELNGWAPPSGWMTDPDASSILMAAFFSDTGARITLTALAGDGGGGLGNINRWRGQLGLEELATMDDQPTKDLGDGAMIVDLISADEANRIMAGIVPMGRQSLYFKLTGSVDEVNVEIEAFEAFVRQVGLEGR